MPAQQDDAAARAVLDDLVGQYLRKLDPALVAPVVAFLAHRDCPVTGEIYTVGAGHVARFFIGRTKGFYSPALSIEDVRDHLEEIRDEARLHGARRTRRRDERVVRDHHEIVRNLVLSWAIRPPG